jgi:hypothetical protein
MIRAIIIEDDSNYTLTAIIIHICPYTPILRTILGTFHSLLRPNRPQSKGGALASLQLNLKRRSLQHLQAVSPFNPLTKPLTLAAPCSCAETEKAHQPTTLPPYHPTNSTTLPPPSSTRTTSSSRAYAFLLLNLPLVPLLCVCFSALDPHSSKSLACVVGCCSPCRRFLQPLEPVPFNTCCCFSVADTRFHCFEPEKQHLHFCMIHQLWSKRERERETPIILHWYQPANPTSSQLRPLAIFTY